MTVWIPLLVPEQDYAELAALVAQRVKQRGETSPAAPDIKVRDVEPPRVVGGAGGVSTGEVTLSTHQPWSVEDLRRLAASTAITSQRWVRALDVCANHVGEWVSTQDIASESGMSINEWRDACRKMTRHAATNYPKELHWPLAAEGGAALGHSYDQLYVALTDEQARRWAEAKAGA